MSLSSNKDLEALCGFESSFAQPSWTATLEPVWKPWLTLQSFLRVVGQRLLPWLVPVLLISVWQIASSLGWMSVRVLPAPLSVVDAAWGLAVSGELAKHVQISAGRALLGLAVGGGLGLALGLLTGSVRWAETLLDSSIQMVRNIPALALIPLVILWFGIDEIAKLFLISVAVFFSNLHQHLPWHSQCRPRSD